MSDVDLDALVLDSLITELGDDAAFLREWIVDYTKELARTEASVEQLKSIKLRLARRLTVVSSD
tara:strand:- start:942 stop:1133 length:192 start_codon:yes stop_codon:yes gene_type:complete